MKISIDIYERKIEGACFFRAIVVQDGEKAALESPRFAPENKEDRAWSMRYLFHHLGEASAGRLQTPQ